MLQQNTAPKLGAKVHTHKLDTQLNEAMCTISGCIRFTPTDFLPFLSGILSPTRPTRRNAACLELHRKSQSPDHLLHETLHVRHAPNQGCGVGSPVIRLRAISIIRLRADSDLQLY